MALATHMRVAALMQRCQSVGEAVYIGARGDRDAGAILVKHVHLNGTASVLVRRYDIHGGTVWDCAVERKPESEVDAYLTKRRASDSDLWIVEVESRRDTLPLTDI